MLMSLGPHVFTVIGLNGREIELVTEAIWSEFGRFGQSDGAHFTGMKRAVQVIRGQLFPDAIGGLADYQAIRATQYAGRPVPMLRMGAGSLTASVLGRVTIEQVSDLTTYGGAMLAFDVTVRSYV
jgi:phage protein U